MRLRPELLRALGVEATRRGMTRSQLVEQILATWVKLPDRSKAIGLTPEEAGEALR